MDDGIKNLESLEICNFGNHRILSQRCYEEQNLKILISSLKEGENLQI